MSVTHSRIRRDGVLRICVFKRCQLKHLFARGDAKLAVNISIVVLQRVFLDGEHFHDFFGRFSLFGTKKDKDIIQNILFPQLE